VHYQYYRLGLGSWCALAIISIIDYLTVVQCNGSCDIVGKIQQ